MKKILIGFILGGLIFGSIVYATSYYAKDVAYEPTDASWEVNNVEDALDSLYEDIELKNNIGFETISNPVGTALSTYNAERRNKQHLTFTFSERLGYNSETYSDYMTYIYPIDFTDVTTLTLYQWNYISMHFTIAFALSDEPLYSRQDIIDNAFTTWTYSTKGTDSSGNYNKKTIDVSAVSGKKYMCMAIVSRNYSSDSYYQLTNNIISFS